MTVFGRRLSRLLHVWPDRSRRNKCATRTQVLGCSVQGRPVYAHQYERQTQSLHRAARRLAKHHSRISYICAAPSVFSTAGRSDQLTAFLLVFFTSAFKPAIRRSACNLCFSRIKSVNLFFAILLFIIDKHRVYCFTSLPARNCTSVYASTFLQFNDLIYIPPLHCCLLCKHLQSWRWRRWYSVATHLKERHSLVFKVRSRFPPRALGTCSNLPMIKLSRRRMGAPL